MTPNWRRCPFKDIQFKQLWTSSRGTNQIKELFFLHEYLFSQITLNLRYSVDYLLIAELV